jgi:hypothetical protein
MKCVMCRCQPVCRHRTLGIDPGNNSFHLVGQDERGATTSDVSSRVGHAVRLIPPAYVKMLCGDER